MDFKRKDCQSHPRLWQIGTTEPMQSNRLGWTRASAFELRDIVRIIPRSSKYCPKMNISQFKNVHLCTICFDLPEFISL